MLHCIAFAIWLFLWRRGNGRGGKSACNSNNSFHQFFISYYYYYPPTSMLTHCELPRFGILVAKTIHSMEGLQKDLGFAKAYLPMTWTLHCFYVAWGRWGLLSSLMSLPPCLCPELWVTSWHFDVIAFRLSVRMMSFFLLFWLTTCVYSRI